MSTSKAAISQIESAEEKKKKLFDRIQKRIITNY